MWTHLVSAHKKEKKGPSSCSLTAESIKNFFLFFLVISDFVHSFIPCIYNSKQLSLNLSSSLEFPNSVLSDIGYIHSTIFIVWRHIMRLWESLGTKCMLNRNVLTQTKTSHLSECEENLTLRKLKISFSYRRWPPLLYHSVASQTKGKTLRVDWNWAVHNMKYSA